MKSQFRDTDRIRMSVRIGIAYGVLAALAFSLATWGMDGFQLAGANGSLPWAKLVIGGVPCLVAGIGVGWITGRLDSALVRGLAWGLTGLLMAWWAGQVPFGVLYTALGYLDPAAYALVDYPVNVSAATGTIINMVAMGGLGVIAGLLQSNMMEATRLADTIFGRALSVLIWLAFFVAGGVVIDSQINQPMREPVVVMNYLIDFALQNENRTVEPALARAMHLGALSSVKDLLHEPRKLILGRYDDLVVSTNVYVDFGGTWVDCMVVNASPSFCGRLGQ